MLNIALYAFCVVIWGASWIGMSWQTGVVPEMQAIGYRFALAAALIAAWCVARRVPLGVPARMHLRLALQGALMFGLNFFLFYSAMSYVSSGLLAVTLSTAAAFVPLFSAALLRQRVPGRLWAGIAIGLAGIALIFWPEIDAFSLTDAGAIGLLLGLGGTITFSLGNIVGAWNQRAGAAIWPMTGWGMAYGAALSLLVSAALGQEFTFDPRLRFVGSLVYITIFATVLGFGFYFTLFKRIGPARTAYSTVLIPVVALGVSTLLEGYQWSLAAVAGVVLVLGGNVLVLMPRRGVVVAAEPAPEARA